MLRLLIAWFGTRREIAETLHQYKLDLGEARLVIAGMRNVIEANECELVDALESLQDARLRIAQLELQL